MIGSELERLTPEGPMMRPTSRRTAEFAGGEWDWYYQLSPAHKRAIAGVVVTGAAYGPDQCARAAGYDDVDVWASDLVAAATGRPMVDGWEEQRVIENSHALVGPVEIGELCGVKVDTVYQWVTRGRLPAPWAIVSGTRLWPRDEIEEWALTTGRLVESAGPDF